VQQAYIADAPGNGALLACGRCLVGLALNAQVHDVVSADGAVVDDNVPRPQRYGIPLHRVSRVFVVSSCVPTFLTSKRFLSPLSVLAPALATFVLGTGASAMSTSAMVDGGWWRVAGDE
jgi:hypothetical protein